MRRVFVDTSVFFAFLVAEEVRAEDARVFFERANEERWALVTTNAVVSETYTLLRSRARHGRRRALEFLDAVDGDEYAIVRCSSEDERAAARILRANTDHDYSYCDALSFAVTDRIGIQEAASFDRHFQEYGRLTMLCKESESTRYARALDTSWAEV